MGRESQWIKGAGSALLAVFAIGLHQAVSAEPRLQLAEGTARVAEIELAYRMGGSGPPLLLLHGFTFTGQQWDPFLDELGKSFTVLVPDLPGHGGSTPFPGAFADREAARVLFALLDDLRIEGFRGVGHSAGATTLVHMAVQQPGRVKAMVLVSGAHRLSIAGRKGLGELELEDMSPTIRAYYQRHHPRGEPQIRSLFAQLRSFADNHEDFDLSPEHLSTIQARTLLVWGDRDAAYPLEFALEMHRAIPSSALWVVPRQGHYPIWAWLGGSQAAQAIFPTVIRDFLE